MEDIVDRGALQQLESAIKRQILIFHRIVGPGQRGIHANVALVARKRPEDDAPLHRFRNAIVALLDALEGHLFGHDFGADVEQAVGAP